MDLPRAPLLWLTVPAIAGILLAAFLPTPIGLTAGAVLVFAGVALPKRSDLPAFLAVAGAFLLAHGLAVSHREAAPRWHEIESGDRPLATVTGSIRNITPPSRGGGRLWNYELRADTITTGDKTSHGAWRILLACPDEDLGFGDHVQVHGTYSIPGPTRNPNGFDRRKWILNQGYVALVTTSEPAVRIDPPDGLLHVPQAILGRQVRTLRLWLGRTITAGLESDSMVCGVLRAISLGDRTGLPRDLEETFRLSGTMHLFAVSGLHVAMVAGLLLGLLRILRIPMSIAMPIVVVGLIVYTMATGMRPSALRATLMVIVYWSAVVFDRNPSLLNTLGLAALVLLTASTWDLFSAGFQLSFAVMLGIGLVGAPLREWFRAKVEPDPFLPRSLLTSKQRNHWKFRRTIADNVAISTGAWAGSILPVLLYFRLVTPSVVVANLFLIYPAFLILWIAGISILSGAVGLSWISVTANHANWLLVKVVTVIAAAFAAMPGGHFFVGGEKLVHSPGRIAQVTAFDISSGGAATHISLREADWFLDCGDPGSFYDALLPHLRSSGRSKIDGVVLSHGDSRHIGGIIALAEAMPEAAIWKNQIRSKSTIEKEIDEALMGRDQPLKRGDSLALGKDGASAEILYPPDGLQPRLADDGCIVARIQIGPHRILWTGDSGLTAEHWLVENEPDLSADIILMGRHSGDFCGDMGFVRAVGPRVILASNQPFPEGQKLPEDWREKVEAEGIHLLDHRRSGSIRIDLKRDGSLTVQPTFGRDLDLESRASN